MQNIVGQKKLVQQLSSYTLATLPTTILILGPKGSGKSFIIDRFAKMLNLVKVELTSATTVEDLLEAEQSYETRLYHLDLVGIDEKKQNKFLKFIEEPNSKVKIILEAESEVGVLPTILNRCRKFTLEPYTIEELQSFAWAPRSSDMLMYKFCSTPGQLLELASTDCFSSLEKLCRDIIIRFPKMTDYEYPRAMSISTKISGDKTSPKKYDLNLFLDMLAYVAITIYKETFNPFSLAVYQLTINQQQRILNKSIAKDAFMFNFLTSLWEARSI